MTWAYPPYEFPSGVVMPFFGAAGEVPDGWVVCDGNNGTSDLRDRFVKSTSSATELPGSTGGANSITLSTSQLPSHSHSGSTSTDNDHTHTYSYSTPNVGDIYSADTMGSGDNDLTSSDGSHTHGASVDNAGSGNSVDNRPSHIETLFIMKL